MNIKFTKDDIEHRETIIGYTATGRLSGRFRHETMREMQNTFEHPLGEVLIDLLNADYDAIEKFVNEKLQLLDQNTFHGELVNLENCEAFTTLSACSQYLLKTASQVRLATIRYNANSYRVRSGRPRPLCSPISFDKMKKIVRLVRSAIERNVASEGYFRFVFKYYLQLLRFGDIYSRYFDSEVLNYAIPVIFAYIQSSDNSTGATMDSLQDLILDSEWNATSITKLIDSVPTDCMYGKMMDKLKVLYWIDEKHGYRTLPKQLADVISEFSDDTSLQEAFIDAIYLYHAYENEKTYICGEIEEYVAICIFECYKRKLRLGVCTECNKVFLHTGNNQKTCVSPACKSSANRKSAQSRKDIVRIDDHNVFTAVRKALTYRRINGKEVPDRSLYVDSEISKEQAEKVFAYMENLVGEYQELNKQYKRIVLSGKFRNRCEKEELYRQWLSQIKDTYKKRSIREIFSCGTYGESSKDYLIELPFFEIDASFQQVITTVRKLYPKLL